MHRDIVFFAFRRKRVDLSNLANGADRAAEHSHSIRPFVTDQKHVWIGTLDPSYSSFLRGDLAMYFGYSWIILQLTSQSKSFFSNCTRSQLSDQHIDLASYWAEGRFRQKVLIEEALLFMKYLATKKYRGKNFSR